MTIAVVQLGARMHYAVPRIFFEAGVLGRFFTDTTADRGWPQLLNWVPKGIQPHSLRKLLARRPSTGVAKSHIVSFSSLGFRYALALRRSAGNPSKTAAAHLAAGRRLAARSIRKGFAGASAVYAFNSAALDVFREAKRLGMTTIYEQTIAPVRFEWRLLKDEHQRWPGWESSTVSDDFYAAFAEVETEEWKLSDAIVCGSDFVKNAIREMGGPVERCTSVPYGVDLTSKSPAKRSPPMGRPLRVLTVGTIGLRKGAPYVAAVAKALAAVAHFRWIGPVNLDLHGREELGRHVQLTGGVPRSEMESHYRWADVFLLPSICEGSATVTYEALGYGLPIVVTPNTGAPIRGGCGGELVPIRDPEAATSKLQAFIDDPNHWMEAHEAACKVANQLTVEAYGERLLAALPDSIRRV